MASGMEYELPPRKHADHLVHIYWSFVDPLFPVLNKTSFMRSYGTLFSGIAVDTNERILVSTLNAVFALSIQLQESLKPNQRDRLSGKYFQRAHDLLRLRIWERGSIELVQCLLVMSQYLQCTDKPHQTWMVVGSAVRIAQSLGFHLPETWASPSNDQGAALSCRIWQACIAMDRTICVTHGRPTMISEALAATVIESKRRTCLLRNKDDQLPHEEFLAKAVELYEITNQTVHKFISSAHTRYYNADLSGIINPSQNEEKLAIIIQVDGCLCRWENSLPAHLKFENASRQPDDICRRQAIILHLRLLHARILLFRPMLARCCLVVEPDSLDGSLSDHIMQQCALSCVEAARNMISVLRQHQKHDGSIGMLPAWWYRVFYIYTAATILAVSTLRPDIFTHAETINSWEEALLLFQAHEHLSESVRVCLSALQIMFSKIQQTQDVSMSSLLFDGFPSEPQGAPVTECPDFIQNFPFGLDYSTLFNLDGMSSVISGQFPSQ
ncbi:C6 transcription factor [Penicillium canescens]|uniref:C6 transcription factor n=1 Tax=Penicillium canescens TaxID=5083 RepID=UPI0026E1136F|nr:C6 transcription factor [Penicillium canescens]KAJ6058316.1 C6 transcription factor [Penicillium canescens]